MSPVRHHGHGVWCHICQTVYDGTDGCDHHLSKKDGVQKTRDGYEAVPADMGHFSPCHYIEVDGLQTCAECGRVKLPLRLVEGSA